MQSEILQQSVVGGHGRLRSPKQHTAMDVSPRSSAPTPRRRPAVPTVSDPYHANARGQTKSCLVQTMHVPSVSSLSNPAAAKTWSEGIPASLCLHDSDFVASLEHQFNRRLIRHNNSPESGWSRQVSRESQGSRQGTSIGNESRINSKCIVGSRRASKNKQPDAVYQLLPTDPIHADEVEQNGLHSMDQPSGSACQERGVQFLQSVGFQTIMAFLIIANSLVIGMETDIRDFEYWDMIEHGFLIAFSLELFLKLCIYGFREFFKYSNVDFNWNVFDSFIVLLGALDFASSFILGKSAGGGATLFRIIRLLRILRIVRIVKFLKQLYLLAFGLAEAVQAVFWVTILMTFIVYVCAIVMVKTVGRPHASDPNHEFLNYHFGAVLSSMLTLFVLMSSPDFSTYQDQTGLLEERPLLAIFLIVFIVFGSFGMIALLTGVISESMFEKNDMKKEEERIAHEVMRKDMSIRCTELFEMLEKDDEGEANVRDVKELIPEIRATFEACGVFFTEYDLHTMVKYMDIDQNDTVSKEEFTRGMLVLAEGVRPISIQEVHHEVGIVRVKVERIETLLRPYSDEAMLTRSKSLDSALQEVLKTQNEAFKVFFEKIDQVMHLQREAIQQRENEESVLDSKFKVSSPSLDNLRGESGGLRHEPRSVAQLPSSSCLLTVPDVGVGRYAAWTPSSQTAGLGTPSKIVGSVSAWPGSSVDMDWRLSAMQPPPSSVCHNHAPRDEEPPESLHSSLRLETEQSQDALVTFGVAGRLESRRDNSRQETHWNASVSCSSRATQSSVGPSQSLMGCTMADVANNHFPRLSAGEAVAQMQECAGLHRCIEADIQRLFDLASSSDVQANCTTSAVARDISFSLGDLIHRIRNLLDSRLPWPHGGNASVLPHPGFHNETASVQVSQTSPAVSLGRRSAQGGGCEIAAGYACQDGSPGHGGLQKCGSRGSSQRSELGELLEVIE